MTAIEKNTHYRECFLVHPARISDTLEREPSESVARFRSLARTR